MQLEFECDPSSPRSDIDAAMCLDAARDATIALDHLGRVLVWSAGAQRMYGWRADEIVGRTLPWPTPDGRAIEHRQLHDLAGRGVVVGLVDIETPRRNGSTTVVEVSTDPVRDETGRIVGTCAIHRDVTLRAAGSNGPVAAGGVDIDLMVDEEPSGAIAGFDALCDDHRLEPLERDLIALLLTGHRIPEMARVLHRSQGTVRNRLSLLYRKFGVRSQIELLDRLHGRLGRGAPSSVRDVARDTSMPPRGMTDESDLGPYERDAWSGDAARGGRATVGRR